jgi:hypothetical protein
MGAYRLATYSVFAYPRIDLRIGVYSQALADCMAAGAASSAALITGDNPFGNQQDERSNAEAILSLHAQLSLYGAPDNIYLAWGTDPYGEWPTEKGYLMLGLSLETASLIARRFNQNALVFIGQDAVPQLVPLTHRK